MLKPVGIDVDFIPFELDFAFDGVDERLVNGFRLHVSKRCWEISPKVVFQMNRNQLEA